MVVCPIDLCLFPKSAQSLKLQSFGKSENWKNKIKSVSLSAKTADKYRVELDDYRMSTESVNIRSTSQEVILVIPAVQSWFDRRRWSNVTRSTHNSIHHVDEVEARWQR